MQAPSASRYGDAPAPLVGGLLQLAGYAAVHEVAQVWRACADLIRVSERCDVYVCVFVLRLGEQKTKPVLPLVKLRNVQLSHASLISSPKQWKDRRFSSPSFLF